MIKKMLTVNEFSDIYGPGRTQTYELFKRGVLRRIKFGARTFIPTEDADAWRDALLQAQAEDAAA